MNAKTIDLADQEKAIQKEEDELSQLLGRVMGRPLEPLNDSLAKMEHQVSTLDEVVREVKDVTLGGLTAQVLDLEEALRKLKSNGDRQKEEFGRLLSSRFEEARVDINSLGEKHERTKEQLALVLSTGQQQIRDEIHALCGGLSSQSESVRREVADVLQQMQTQQVAKFDEMKHALSELASNVAIARRRIRWFGATAAIFGLATLTLILLHPM